ncbi:MAG: hypothetical protein K8E66_02355 [Phycisphaerales bacterium]|nr:hypothetical protein [Phycisphaerales bacterium]
MIQSIALPLAQRDQSGCSSSTTLRMRVENAGAVRSSRSVRGLQIDQNNMWAEG